MEGVFPKQSFPCFAFHEDSFSPGPNNTTFSLSSLWAEEGEGLPSIASVWTSHHSLSGPLSLPIAQETVPSSVSSFAHFGMKCFLLKPCLIHQAAFFLCSYNLAIFCVCTIFFLSSLFTFLISYSVFLHFPQVLT